MCCLDVYDYYSGVYCNYYLFGQGKLLSEMEKMNERFVVLFS